MIRYGRWTVLPGAPVRPGPRALCRCDCGTERYVRLAHLRDGVSLSCGCLKRELARVRIRLQQRVGVAA